MRIIRTESSECSCSLLLKLPLSISLVILTLGEMESRSICFRGESHYQGRPESRSNCKQTSLVGVEKPLNVLVRRRCCSLSLNHSLSALSWSIRKALYPTGAFLPLRPHPISSKVTECRVHRQLETKTMIAWPCSVTTWSWTTNP